MQFSTIRVTPDPKYTAEVVVLLTTLGAKRTEYNAGKRACDLLEIKRVHHKIIDFNRDARQAGTGEAENKAIQKLMDQNKLHTGKDDDLILPQMFIDGFYIGDATELQGMEDDNVLTEVLQRRKCVNCNANRVGAQCGKCGTQFDEILPGMMSIEEHLQKLAMHGGGYDDSDDDSQDDED